MKIRMLYVLVSLVLVSCNNNQKEGVAHITQRKILANGRLLISYTFKANEKIIVDSMEFPNQIVPHDSVIVVFSSENPTKSKLRIP
jgi:uncharacterized protein YcfL